MSTQPLLKNTGQAQREESGNRYQDADDLNTAVQNFGAVVDLTSANHPDKAQVGGSEAALQKAQEAVDLTPADHPDRAYRLQSLAVSFGDWYQRLGDLKDLEAALQKDQEAVNLTPADHPDRAYRLQSLARLGDLKDLEAALQNKQEAVNLTPADHPDRAGHTIPVRQDAIHRLGIGYTASAATRISITLSNLYSAVEFFEQGLATTFQQMLQLKPDLDMLPPEQAEHLRQLSHEIYSGISNNPSKVVLERQELLQIICKQPGLQHFLLPPPYRVLCHASQQGPVVMLNSHKDGCDGIIILNPMSDPVHVAFPNASLKSQQSTLKKLLNRCDVRTHGESVSHGIHNGRLWWLLSGSFIGLPLHACPPTNEFIHSYTATLGSLLAAQAKNPSNTHYKLGVVGVIHTGPGGVNYLKGVKQEVDKICSVIKVPKLVCLKGDQATPDAVKAQLQSCSWVHLACHGVQDLREPTKSRLLLYGRVLELGTILQMPLSNAELVFLAACQTAMGDADLVDESFHLGGGFIAAGFCSAIGTLWSMNDQDRPVVAEAVYSHLFRDGRQPQAGNTAEALQLAVNKLKAQKIPYEHWIPFIHIGV
ncbi:CHAT domain-containing protein [Mycena maculata]|uniref:CHAT domain-containing protein n=1 Tax=Mycena maculata TaxID=230809 RepID=A0AAD7HNE3_9AGAR|nr:CHAT domain-containing protein [Mycena maculata]